jgi:uncharacterized protein
MRTITLEEHFASPGFMEGPGRKLTEHAANFGERARYLLERLTHLDETRTAEMDKAGIDMQFHHNVADAHLRKGPHAVV